MGDLIMPMGDGGSDLAGTFLGRDPPHVPATRAGPAPRNLLTAVVQLKRRFEEESVNLHVNRIVDANADDATDLLRYGK
jgi:hypothetical protein